MITPRDLWQTLRPYQWIKNGFVLMGLLFGHAWEDTHSLMRILTAAAAFCLVSSAVYVFNDLIDRDRDRSHPTKRERPIAAGRIAPGSAVALSALVFAAALALAAWAGDGVLMIVAGYAGMNVLYTLRLKHVVILDVFIISAGFMLRILAGTWGVGIPPSHWLLFCGMMITLFLGFAKRRAEMGVVVKDEQENHRAVLTQYTPLLLDTFIAVTSMGVIISYSLYTMSPETIAVHGTNRLIFTVPFIVYGLFRYVFLLHASGSGGDPARDLFRDLHLLGAVVGWLGVTLWLLL